MTLNFKIGGIWLSPWPEPILQGIGLRFDEQSGHSSSVANRIYGRNSEEILSVAESIEEEFYYTSILWHRLLNVSLNVQLPFNYQIKNPLILNSSSNSKLLNHNSNISIPNLNNFNLSFQNLIFPDISSSNISSSNINSSNITFPNIK